MDVRVALEWFLNPDHLPFIVGIREGWFREAGLELSLVVPDAHYDGMAAVTAGDVAFAVNEPLHMFDAARPGLKALGCFFETDGGVMLRADAAERAAAGGPVRIASPVAGGVTDAVCREILARWAAARGGRLPADAVSIEEAGFGHVANMRAGFDGAWLCFANFEGVQARHEGPECLFVATRDVGLENFSALELFTSEAFLAEHPDAVRTVRGTLTRAVGEIRRNPARAADHWFAYSGEARTPLSEAIVADTVGRFVAPVERSAERWRTLYRGFAARGHSAIDEAGYEALYA
jgi:putative hydroxymethylpyrimidine transport system substrate-binding protein